MAVIEFKLDTDKLCECINEVMEKVEIETGITLNECVEKQRAKKPALLNPSFSFTGCPECGTRMCSNYCPNCGQRIDWSEIDNGS